MQSNVPWIEMNNDLSEKAIKAALKGEWQEAVSINLTLLAKDKINIATLNRLGRSYTELGKIDEAKKTYRKVIQLDKYNPIAKKNLRLLKTKKRSKTSNDQKTATPPIRSNFLEEPGKTKTTQLVRLADADVIANLHIGQIVTLEGKKRAVSVKTRDNTYIGSLPDDLSFRLGKLIRAGNKYETLIKDIEGHKIQIFIRETHRSSRLKNSPSFPNTNVSSYNADIRHTLLEEIPVDTRETGEENGE